MHPIAWLIDNPVKVSVGVILLVMFGVIALFQMPMQLSPDVERPQVTVQTAWPGASPQEIENEIIKEQEERLKAVEGLVKMSSECMDSFGQITLEFRVGTKMDSALLKVNNALQQVPSYPIDAREPVIRTSNTNDNSIGWFILSPRPPSREELQAFARQHPDLHADIERVLRAKMTGLINYRLRELAQKDPRAKDLAPPDLDMSVYGKFAEDVIEAQFERIPGVSDAFVRGGRRPQMHVVIDPHRLAGRGVTISDLRNALTNASVDISAGDYMVGKSRVVVRTLGQYRSPEQILDQIIATQDGVPILVRDVADVALGFEKTTGFVQRFGVSSMSVSVNRDTGANVIEIMRRLDREVERLNQGVLAQEGLMLTKVYDETTYIRSAVGLVQQNIVLGGALTIIVLMLFLHIGARAVIVSPLILASGLAAIYFSPWLFVVTLAIVLGTGFWFARGTLVVGIAIPISVIGTFLILREMGRSLNVISLAGMAFAVGMLVDNAVVVLENIFRFWRLGHSPLEAARRGVGEVWGAVLASTLTTLAVFLPVIFLQGEVGQLFGDIALAISAAVGLSLIVSVIVIPTAASRIMADRHSTAAASRGSGSRVARRLEQWGVGLRQSIVSSNRWLQEKWSRRLVTVAAILGAIAALGWWLYPKVEYLPAGNRNLVFCSIQTPPGYNVHQLNAIGKEVEELLKPYWDIEPSTEDTAHLDYPSIADFFYMARERSVFVGMRAHDELRARKLIDLVMKKLDGRFPGTQIRAFQTSIFGRGLSGGRNIDIEITGPDLHRLVEIGGRVMADVKQQIPNGQARPIPSLDLSSPELHVVLKPEQASALGVTSRDLGYAVNALVDGAYAADYFLDGEKIDLVIMGKPNPDEPVFDLAAEYIATPVLPEPVRLDVVSRQSLAAGPEQINRRERQRAISIEVSPPIEISLEQAIATIEREIIAPLEHAGIIGNQYFINLSGTADKLHQTWEALRWNFLLAILITYLLMAALFESWVYPLIIILSVPLGAVGGLIGLQLLSAYLVAIGEPPQSLDVLTMLGFVILVGTVVNNAILIVHQSRVFRSQGVSPHESISASLETRVRPIFMTTLTTIFGLSPLVFFPGAGSELYRGIGSVVFGGLLLSTILTLVLIPMLLSMLVDAQIIWARRRDQRSAHQTDVKPRRRARAQADGNGQSSPPREPATTTTHGPHA